MGYSGVSAKIPLGELGLLTDIASDKCPPNSLILANNVSYSAGSIEKAPGAWIWNTGHGLPDPIVACHWWEPNTYSQPSMIAVTSTGSIYKGKDRQWGTIADVSDGPINTGLGTLSPNCVFAVGGNEVAGNDRKLFLFTGGVTKPYVLAADGTTFAAISLPATDWAIGRYPKFGLIHRNRLWAFSGQNYYASDTANHENFSTNSLSETIYPGEGGELRGGFVFKGRLFAFKDGGFVYLLDDSSATETDWIFVKVASNFGLSAPNACAEVLNDMLAGNTAGTITNYIASQKLGGIEAADVIQSAQFETHLRANTTLAGLNEQHIIYYPNKKQLWATYKTGAKTYNDAILVLDFSRQQVRASLWPQRYALCLGLWKDAYAVERPMYGGPSGYIMIGDYETRTEGDSGQGSASLYDDYTGDFQTPHLDFSHLDPKLSTIQKSFDFIAVHYIPEGSATNLSCDYFVDGRFIETLSLPLVQNLNSVLGSLNLDEDRLAEANGETSMGRLTGTGRTFSARLYMAGSKQSFQIQSITVGFRPGGQQAQKV